MVFWQPVEERRHAYFEEPWESVVRLVSKTDSDIAPIKSGRLVAMMLGDVRRITRDIAPAESPLRTTCEALPPN